MDSLFRVAGVVLGCRRKGQQLADRARRKFLFTVALLAGMCILCAPAMLGKEKKPPTKTVSGVVFDEAENPIDGATVELTDLQTGKVVAIYSQEQGDYQFSDLIPSHDYKIKASFKGSSSEVRQISSVDTRARLVMNLTILGLKR